MPARKPHKYAVGEKIGDYRILEQTRGWSYSAYIKSYEIECTICGWQKTMRETTIVVGDGLYHTACGQGLKDKESRFHRIWHNMKQRCDNPNNTEYHNYGGRGITHSFSYFWDFKRLMYESYLDHCEEYGEYDTFLERIDNEGNYEHCNMCWATRYEQAENKRNIVYFRYVSPDSEIGVDYNTSRFERNHGCSRGSIRNYLNGYKNTCNGWHFVRITKEECLLEYPIRERAKKLHNFSLDTLQQFAASKNIPTSENKNEIIENIVQ